MNTGETVSPAAVDREAGPLVAIVAAAVVLAPFGTTGLPFRTALVMQALAVSLLVALLLGVGVLRPGWRVRLRRTPAPFAVPVLVYATVAVQGAVVGMIRGNRPEAVAGQLLSMGLLPLAAAAGFLSSQRTRAKFVAAGIVAGASGAAALHVAMAARRAFLGATTYRFYLGNNVSVSGVVLLALLAACGLLSQARRVRLALTAAMLLLVLALLASGTRSLWVASVVGVGVFVVLEMAHGRARSSVWLQAAFSVMVIIAIVLTAAVAWWKLPRPAVDVDVAAMWSRKDATTVEMLAPAGGSPILVWRGDGRRVGVRLGEGLPVQPGSYRIELEGGHLGGDARTVVWLYARDGFGNMCWRRPFEFSGRERTKTMGPASFPQGTVTASVVARASDGCSRGRHDPAFYLQALRLERVSVSPLPALLAREIEYLVLRGRSLGRVGDEASVETRLAELGDVLRAYRKGGVLVWLLGAGLGATFEVADDTPGNGHYIHNFYAFLLYKLGALGLVAVVAGFFALARAFLRVSRRGDADGTGALTSAFAAAWVAYLVWSAGCPEILDFRLAPLWGLVVSAAAASEGGGCRGGWLRNEDDGEENTVTRRYCSPRRAGDPSSLAWRDRKLGGGEP